MIKHVHKKEGRTFPSLKLCYRERWSEVQYVFDWQGANTLSPGFGELAR